MANKHDITQSVHAQWYKSENIIKMEETFEGNLIHLTIPTKAKVRTGCLGLVSLGPHTHLLC